MLVQEVAPGVVVFESIISHPMDANDPRQTGVVKRTTPMYDTTVETVCRPDGSVRVTRTVVDREVQA